MANKQIVDARGLSCPQPVLMTKKAIESGEKSYEILVDNGTARENDLFKAMQAKKIHMTIVVDEYGQTAGLVTMEDILV